MLASAIRPRPPGLPSPELRDAVRTAGILAGSLAFLILATLALSRLMTSSSGPAVIGPMPGALLELGSEPTGVGGQLVISGQRTGELIITTAHSESGYEPDPNTAGGLAYARGEIVLRGAGGELELDPDSGTVTRVEFDGLSFYLDPGDCTATPGGHNAELGLLHVRLSCTDVADLRSGVLISVEGVISVPADALGDRGLLPETGGLVDLGGRDLELVEGVGLVGGTGPVDEGLIPLLLPADPVTSLGVMYDPEDHSYALTGIQLEGAFTELASPCPLTSEALGRLNPKTTVVRLTIDCEGVPLPDGTTAPMSGSVVIDLVDLDAEG